jgi:RHS repeat-associated protein
VAKGTISTWSCDPAIGGLFYTESYVLSPGGQQLTMLDGNGNWQRTNAYAGGALLATYDTSNLHFHLSDPLGTRRVQTSAAGFAETECESLPFGDDLTCFPVPNAPSTANDSTPLHFTGKERDTESGNDYFDARYYSSAMGRFMSPDWSAQEEPVPYASLDDPQSLNLYAYVRNNPLARLDADGHGCPESCPFPLNLLMSQGLPETKEQNQLVFQGAANSPVVQGAELVGAAGLAGPEVLAAAAEATTVPQGLAVGVAALGATGIAVNGTTDIIAGLSGASQSKLSEANNAVAAVTNPIAGAVSIVTGSTEKGSQAADLATVAQAGTALAKGKGVNPLEVATSLGGAKESVSATINKVSSAISGALAPTPPPPPTPKPPSTPSCSIAGAC